MWGNIKLSYNGRIGSICHVGHRQGGKCPENDFQKEEILGMEGKCDWIGNELKKKVNELQRLK